MPLKEGRHSRFNQPKRRSVSKQPRAKELASQKPLATTPASAAGTPGKENELSSKKLKKIQQLIYKDTQPFGLATSARDELEREQQAKSFR